VFLAVLPTRSAAFVVSFSEPPKPAPKRRPVVRMLLSRWTRPCFSSTPRHVTRACFRPFTSPRNPKVRGRRVLCPLPRPACGLVTSGKPFWERPAGPKHTRAEQVKA